MPMTKMSMLTCLERSTIVAMPEIAVGVEMTCLFPFSTLNLVVMV